MIVQEPLYYGQDTTQPSPARTVFTGAVLILAVLTVFGKGPLRRIFR